MRIGDTLIQTWRMIVAARWIPKDSRLLDIGCHQGEFLDFLGNRIAPSVGIDPLFAQTQTPSKHQFFSWKFERTLPFPDGSFDAISMLATIEHLPNKPEIAGETWRLLRNGGRVVITVPSPLVDHLLSILIALRIVDGMSMEEHHGFVPQELPDVFKKAGFEIAAWKKFQFGLNNLFVFGKQGNTEHSKP
jgi:ubiquinone/menaquinone biosynthesis C-methylase UbiE